jgi:hypothetical protein
MSIITKGENVNLVKKGLMSHPLWDLARNEFEENLLAVRKGETITRKIRNFQRHLLGPLDYDLSAIHQGRQEGMAREETCG